MSSYSLARVKSSLIHFIQGQTVSAIFGVLVTLIMVREMPVDDYAIYTVFLGFTLLVGSVSSFAIEQAAQRFLPELLVNKHYDQLYSLVFMAVITRLCLLLFVTGFLYVGRNAIADFFSLAIDQELFSLWLFVIVFIISYRFLNVLLQVFLQHHVIKWLAVGLNLTRFFFVLSVLLVNLDLSLDVVVRIELGAYMVFSLLSLMYFFKGVVKSTGYHTVSIRFSSVNKRITDFIKYFSLRQIITMFSGHAMNRLVVGKYLSASVIGEYGFSQSLMEIFGRYTPSQLLNNMIQPVVMAKYSENHDITKVVEISGLVLKLNYIILLPLFFIVMLIGEPGSIFVTKGNYPDSAFYLAGLIIILMLQSHMYFLQLIATAAETIKHLFVGSIILAVFFIPIIFLIIAYGIWGLIIGKILGMLVRDMYVARRIESEGIRCNFDRWGVGRILLSALIPYLLFNLIGIVATDIYNLIIIVLLYGVFYFPFLYLSKPFNIGERIMLQKLIRRKNKN